jgi:DnaK suppressor protein
VEPAKHERRRLSQEELNHIRDDVLRQKRDLWQEVADVLERDAREEHADLIHTIRDEGDAALEELREGNVFSLIDMKHNQLQLMEEALQRIDSGEYGRCTDCGRWIRPARLEIMPYAIRCRKCQEKREKRAAH